jgi:hypothetical protein
MSDPNDNNDSAIPEDSVSREFIDPNNTLKWTNNKNVIEEKWLEPMHLVLVTLQYLNDCLKDKEATVGWWLILITSFTSFLTLFSPKELGTNSFFNTHYDWAKSVLLSVLSFTATLLASWAKKKGFVKRIKDLDKRIYSLETKRSIVSSVLALPMEDRPQYITFYKDNIVEVQDLLCYNQLISPTEMSDVLYNLTKNYPTLIKDIRPWYKKTKSGIFEPDYEYGYNIIKSFEKRRLNGLFFRVISCFYCKSSCCYDIDDGNPFTNKQIMSQIIQHKKDDASTKSSIYKARYNLQEKGNVSNVMNAFSEANDFSGISEENASSLFAEFLENGRSKNNSSKLARQSSNLVPNLDVLKKTVVNNADSRINNELSNAINRITSEKTKLTPNISINLQEGSSSIPNNIIEESTKPISQSAETIVNISEALLDSDNDSNPSNNTSPKKDNKTAEKAD